MRIELNHRTVSALIALSYLALALLAGGLEALLRALLFLVLPLACIWFGDLLGGATGLTFGGGYITKTSPGNIVRFLGWVLLATPLIGLVLSLILNHDLFR